MFIRHYLKSVHLCPIILIYGMYVLGYCLKCGRILSYQPDAGEQLLQPETVVELIKC